MSAYKSSSALLEEELGVQAHIAIAHLGNSARRRGIPLPSVLLAAPLLRSLWLSAKHHAKMGGRAHLPTAFHARVHARRGG